MGYLLTGPNGPEFVPEPEDPDFDNWWWQTLKARYADVIEKGIAYLKAHPDADQMETADWFAERTGASTRHPEWNDQWTEAMIVAEFILQGVEEEA